MAVDLKGPQLSEFITKGYFEEDERDAFDFHEFLVEHDYDTPMLNIIKRRLWNYYRYLEFKHIKKNKESAKALKIRKNSRCLYDEINLKVGEKIYNVAKLEGIKQFWVDCVEWRKDEKNQSYLLGYQDFYNSKIKFFCCESDYDDYDTDEEVEKIDQETEKLDWMLKKEK